MSPIPTLREHGGLRVLHTWGAPYERGLQHGQLLRDAVQTCFDEVYRNGFLRASPLLPPRLWYACARLNSVFLSQDERDELRGISDGAGLDYADVLLMNSAPPIDAAHNLLAAGRVSACTQFVVRGAASRGRLLLGRNLDLIGLERLHRYSVVQVQHPSRGHAFVTPGFAGKVLDAITGWNAAGLIVSQDVAELARENFTGLYSGALIRRLVMACANLAEARRMIADLPRLGGGGKNIAVADGAGAEVIEVAQTVLEGARGRKRLHRRSFGECGDPPDSIVVNNHYRTPELATRPASNSTLRRQQRALALLRGRWGDIDVDDLKRFLTDKRDAETLRSHGPTCPSDRIINWYGERVRAFGPFAVPPDLDVHVATGVSTVCDVQAAVMWIASGRAYVDEVDDYVPFPVTF